MALLHLRVGIYMLTEGTHEDATEIAQAPGGILEVFRKQPGFVAYGVGRTDDDFVISLSIWESAEQAQAATATAAGWVDERLESRIELQDDYVGDLLFLEMASDAG